MKDKIIRESFLTKEFSQRLFDRGYDGPIEEKVDRRTQSIYKIISIDCARQWLRKVHNMHIYTVLQYDINHVKGYEGWCYKEDTVSLGSHYCFPTPEQALSFAIGLAMDFERTFEPIKYADNKRVDTECDVKVIRDQVRDILHEDLTSNHGDISFGIYIDDDTADKITRHLIELFVKEIE